MKYNCRYFTNTCTCTHTTVTPETKTLSEIFTFSHNGLVMCLSVLAAVPYIPQTQDLPWAVPWALQRTKLDIYEKLSLAKVPKVMGQGLAQKFSKKNNNNKKTKKNSPGLCPGLYFIHYKIGLNNSIPWHW